MQAPDLSLRPFQLKVERQMTASPQALYKAWTEQWDRWFAAPGTVAMRAAVDAPFCFEVQHMGQRHAHYGRFLELLPDRFVKLTWVTTGTLGAETVVSAEFAGQGGGTWMKLTHAGFPDLATQDQHVQAWPAVLAQLDSKLAGP